MSEFVHYSQFVGSYGDMTTFEGCRGVVLQLNFYNTTIIILPYVSV